MYHRRCLALQHLPPRSGLTRTLGVMNRSTLALVALLACTQANASPLDRERLATTAAKFFPKVVWSSTSIIEAEFSCRGRREFAILGKTEGSLFVAIFTRGVQSKPTVLTFSSARRDSHSIGIASEDMDFDPKGVDDDLGPPPKGMRPSKTCKGIALSDGDTDATHIYWNHQKKRFDSWSQ